MQQGDYNSPYYQYHHPQTYQPPPPAAAPPPPPAPAPPSSYASAPPYAAADYSSYSQNYPPFPHSLPDPAPPTAPPPHYTPPPPPHPPQPTPPESHVPHNSQFQNYTPYDPNYPSANYPPSTTPPSYTNPNSSIYEKSYDNTQNYDHGHGYFGEKVSGYGSFGSSRSNLGGGYDYPDPNSNPNSAINGKSYDSGPKYGTGQGHFEENVGGYGSFGSSRSSLGGGYDFKEYKDDGVYAYEGKNEPYGARGTGGTASKSSNWSGLFDDYGRAISFPKEEKKSGSSGSSGALKVVRAVPKAEDKTDAKSGVQKFRVKLLPESGGQSVMDVLCMVGLDGIRMLDPNTSRTLRIYSLETVTRCDKIDSSTFAFWSKTSVDVEPRRIRLQSNSYTTNTILDTVTAATVQFKEMGGRPRPSELPRSVEQSGEKKKGLTDWINKLKPVNEEKDHWVPDEAATKCTGCGSDFSAFNRRHHCRNCGDVFCDKCTQGRTPLTAEENAQPVRVCDRCMAEVTHRLSKAKEAASRPVTFQSHEDLAKKLQEEMEKNLKISSGSKSEGSGKRMREVACPTCTVHLQVQVPSSGSETIECGVCQHPFLVSSH